jgi:hypothetical protein
MIIDAIGITRDTRNSRLIASGMIGYPCEVA